MRTPRRATAKNNTSISMGASSPMVVLRDSRANLLLVSSRFRVVFAPGRLSAAVCGCFGVRRGRFALGLGSRTSPSGLGLLVRVLRVGERSARARAAVGASVGPGRSSVENLWLLEPRGFNARVAAGGLRAVTESEPDVEDVGRGTTRSLAAAAAMPSARAGDEATGIASAAGPGSSTRGVRVGPTRERRRGCRPARRGGAQGLPGRRRETATAAVLARLSARIRAFIDRKSIISMTFPKKFALRGRGAVGRGHE